MKSLSLSSDYSSADKEDHQADDPRAYSEVRWQWFKVSTTGQREWLNYTEEESAAIEKRFQSGMTHVRVNAGTQTSAKGQLKEIFFGNDMVQYNPVSGKVRDIRRVGPDSIFQKAKRWFNGCVRQLEDGSPANQSFLKYRKAVNKMKSSGSRVGLGSGNLDEVAEKQVHSKFCASIVQNGLFVVVQMIAIVVNTVVMGLDVDHNRADASERTRSVFQFFDHAFCVFFTGEIILRIGAMKKRATLRKTIRGFGKDKMFVLDFLLVAFMLLDTWLLPFYKYMADKDQSSSGMDQLASLRILRLLRLARVGRVAKLLQYFPEILMIVKSILAAMRAVLATLGLLVFILYIFAIIFTARCEQTLIEHMFPTILGSMWTLLLQGFFTDALGDTVGAIHEESLSLSFLFMVFVFVSNLTVLNMLIGVICEVASEVSRKDKETRTEAKLKRDLEQFLACFDMNNDRIISLHEFDLLLKNPDVRSCLQRHEVDVESVLALKKSLFTDKEAMTEDKILAAANLQRQNGSIASLQQIDNEELPWREKTLTFDELTAVILRFQGAEGSNAQLLDVIGLEKKFARHLDRHLAIVNEQIRSEIANLESTTKQGSENIQLEIARLDSSTRQSIDMAMARQDSPMPTSKVVEADTDPDKNACAENAGIYSTIYSSIQPTNTAIAADDPWTKVKEELAQQQSAFSAAINEQLARLVAGQSEIGEFVKDSFASRNQAKDIEASQATIANKLQSLEHNLQDFRRSMVKVSQESAEPLMSITQDAQDFQEGAQKVSQELLHSPTSTMQDVQDSVRGVVLSVMNEFREEGQLLLQQAKEQIGELASQQNRLQDSLGNALEKVAHLAGAAAVRAETSEGFAESIMPAEKKDSMFAEVAPDSLQRLIELFLPAIDHKVSHLIDQVTVLYEVQGSATKLLEKQEQQLADRSDLCVRIHEMQIQVMGMLCQNNPQLIQFPERRPSTSPRVPGRFPERLPERMRGTLSQNDVQQAHQVTVEQMAQCQHSRYSPLTQDLSHSSFSPRLNESWAQQWAHVNYLLSIQQQRQR